MIVREYKLGDSGKVWIDIENPNTEDFRIFCQQKNLNQAHIDDCLQSDHLPKFEESTPLNFIVTRVLHNENNDGHTIQELSTKVSMFIDSQQIMTIHRVSHPFINTIIQECIQQNAIHSTHELAVKILKGVMKSYEKFQIKLALQIDQIEDQIFLKNSKNNFLEELYFLKRKSNIGKKMLLLTREVLYGIKSHYKNTPELRDVSDLHQKLELFYDELFEDVSNLMTVYLSVSSQKTNEVMKVLTVFSVFFMPLTFIVGIYGMNFKFMPELEWKYGYLASIMAMILVSILIGFWFKRKKWL